MQDPVSVPGDSSGVPGELMWSVGSTTIGMDGTATSSADTRASFILPHAEDAVLGVLLGERSGESLTTDCRGSGEGSFGTEAESVLALALGEVATTGWTAVPQQSPFG